MEHRIWLLLLTVFVIGLAVVLTCATVYYFSKRVAVLEKRVADWDLWSDCVDKSLDPMTAYKIQEKYAARKRAGG